MLSQVTLYRNTGLKPGDCLDSIVLLQTLFDKKFSVDAIATKQEKGLSVIRVSTTYEKCKDVDYLTIGKICYYVVDIQMANDNVVFMSIIPDLITTVGIDNIVILTGWCTRRHVNDDSLFSNIIPEPFTPSQEFVIVTGNKITHTSSDYANENFDFVVSTVDLSVSFKDKNGLANGLAYGWEALTQTTEEVASFLGLYTPRINQLSDYTEYGMSAWDGATEDTKYSSVPYTSIFDMASQGVNSELSQMYALGLDNVILDAYTIPGNWITRIDYDDTTPQWYTDMLTAAQTAGVDVTSYKIQGSKVKAISCIKTIESAGLDVVWGEYENNKVYCGQFNRVRLISLTSGDEEEFEVENIINPESTTGVYFVCVADMKFNGNPVCFPEYYRGAVNTKYLGVVNGAPWLKSPIKQVGQSGYLQRRINRVQSYIGGAVNDLGRGLLGVSSQSSTGEQVNVLGNYMNKAGVYKAAARSVYNLGMDVAGEAISNIIGSGYIEKEVPSIQFQPIQSLQNYIGNDFLAYQIRLSDADMKRYDNFLTQYGYAVNEILTTECFTGREYFNYVKAENVSVNIVYINVEDANVSDLSWTSGIKRLLEAGVRIWHTRPTVSALLRNPIKASSTSTKEV